MTINSFASTEEKEQIFKLRYRVYIEELGKSHIQNDHLNKTVIDEYDEGSKYFFAKDQKQVCAALRAIIFQKHHLRKLCSVYKLPSGFVNEAGFESIGFVDRFVIDREFRNGILGLKIMKELYTYTLNNGICYGFINAERALVHTYYQIGYRVYDHFYTTNSEKRYLMVCFMKDFDYMRSINSPLIRCFKDISLSDGESSVKAASEYFDLLKEADID